MENLHFLVQWGFDIGAFIANIILNYLSQEVHMEEVDSRKEYKEYLRTIILDTWNKFESEFRMLWQLELKCDTEFLKLGIDEIGSKASSSFF